MIQRFFDWFVLSSEDPQKAGATIKGVLLSVAIYIVAGSHFLNFNIEQGDVEGLIALITSLITTLLTIFGFVRKIMNTAESK